jgi:hypothetical protein
LSANARARLRAEAFIRLRQFKAERCVSSTIFSREIECASSCGIGVVAPLTFEIVVDARG